ncbi:MAG: hypothetical protein ACFFCS_03490 [Candidatus Hodarchaeota archaeon]
MPPCQVIYTYSPEYNNMLRDLFILDNAGLGIFEWHHESGEQKINLQLVSGLVLALIQFSAEALMDEMQILQLENGFMVVTFLKDDPSRYAVGIYDITDDSRPAKRLNRKILVNFNQEFPVEQYQNQLITKFEVTKHFRQGILPLAISHTAWNAILINIVLYAFIYGIVGCIPSVYETFMQIVIQGFSTDVAYLFIWLVILMPFLGINIFSGSWKRAVWISVIALFAIFGTFVVRDLLTTGVTYLALYDLITGFGWFGGIVGGYLSQLLFLSKKRKKKKKPDGNRTQPSHLDMTESI